MRFISFICLLSATLLISPLHVIAASVTQSDEAEPEIEVKISPREIRNYSRVAQKYDVLYTQILDEVRGGRFDIGRVNVLRDYYTKTSHYTAFSKSVIRQLEFYAYTADTSENLQEKNSALSAYKALADKHVVNLDVVTYMLGLSRINIRFGDETFLKALQKKLKDGFDITLGQKPISAFNIVTYGEETYILNKIGGVVEKSEIYPVNNAFYNVHDIRLRDGSFRQVFVNVSVPVRRMKVKQLAAEQDDFSDIVGGVGDL